MKETLLIVGCGDIALRTAKLLQAHYRILGLLRNLDSTGRLRSHGIIPVYGNLDSPQSLEKLAGIAQLILHLAPPPNHGLRDNRTAHLLSALTKPTKNKAPILPQRLVYISTSGVYGDCRGDSVNEARTPVPGTPRAKRRLDAETRLRAWAKRQHIPLVILRVPGIYAADRLPLERLQAGTPALQDKDDGFTNHIHADDLARAIICALRRLNGIRIYNVVDDSRVKMGEYFDLVADAVGLPRPPRIARSEAEGRISPAMLSFMDESRKLQNRRLHQELRLRLRYPTVESALAQLKPANAR